MYMGVKLHMHGRTQVQVQMHRRGCFSCWLNAHSKCVQPICSAVTMVVDFTDADYVNMHSKAHGPRTSTGRQCHTTHSSAT